MQEDNHFSGQQASQVAARSYRYQKIAISAVIILIVLFILYLLQKKPSSTSHEKEPFSLFSTGNNDIVNQNAKRLLALKDSPAWHEISNRVIQVESKEMIVRRNAPTQLFTSGQNNSALTKANHDANESKTITDQPGGYTQFTNHQPTNTVTLNASHIVHPKKSIVQGELIQATLETAINSDLPGMVRAVVTHPVYAYEGNTMLIPPGSRLIGQYATVMGNGAATRRVCVVWNRVITPEGLSVMINSPSADALGRSGQGADAVDAHFWQIFANATLLSVIGAGVANVGVEDADQPNSADAYRQAIADSFQRSAGKALNQDLSIKPTLHVYHGTAINVFVAHDLDFTETEKE